MRGKLQLGADGQYRMPDCTGCRVHFFDGNPVVKRVANSEETVLIGKVDPHIHYCGEHEPRSPDVTFGVLKDVRLSAPVYRAIRSAAALLGANSNEIAALLLESMLEDMREKAR